MRRIAHVLPLALACVGFCLPTSAIGAALAILAPPASVFVLPAAVVGRPFDLYGGATFRQGAATANTVTSYWWSVKPPLSGATLATYSVGVFRTPALAQAQDTQDQISAEHCVGNYAGCSTQGPPTVPLLSHPAGGWLRGACYTNGCAYTAGAVYQNLTFAVQTDCVASGAACADYTAQVLTLLVGRAAAYASAQAPALSLAVPVRPPASSDDPTWYLPVQTPPGETVKITEVRPGDCNPPNCYSALVAGFATHPTQVIPAVYEGITIAQIYTGQYLLYSGQCFDPPTICWVDLFALDALHGQIIPVLHLPNVPAAQARQRLPVTYGGVRYWLGVEQAPFPIGPHWVLRYRDYR